MIDQKKLLLRDIKNNYQATCDYIINQHSFIDMYIDEKIVDSFSKKKVCFSQLRYLYFLIKNRKKINKYEIIFSVGHVLFPLLFLKKIKILQFKKIYCWSFLYHSHKVFPVIRLLLFFTKPKSNIIFIVFSMFEKHKYHKWFGIKKENLSYVPYGEWGKTTPIYTKKSNYDYYFAGGYSNRDYKKLIMAFSAIDKELIIVCSKNNNDFKDIPIPPNIKIYLDISSAQFDEYLAQAKAVIFPLKENTGASGQSVLLRCMRYKKAVIVTNNDVIKEYVEDGLSGIVIDDILKELGQKIIYLENEPDQIDFLGNNLYNTYLNKFSYDKITKRLSDIIQH